MPALPRVIVFEFRCAQCSLSTWFNFGFKQPLMDCKLIKLRNSIRTSNSEEDKAPATETETTGQQIDQNAVSTLQSQRYPQSEDDECHRSILIQMPTNGQSIIHFSL